MIKIGSSMFGTAIIVICAILIIWIYITHVVLITRRNKVQEAFACIDVQLKKRYDTIPNIIEIAKGYMRYEKSVLEEITKIRTLFLNPEDIKKKLF